MNRAKESTDLHILLQINGNFSRFIVAKWVVLAYTNIFKKDGYDIKHET